MKSSLSVIVASAFVALVGFVALVSCSGPPHLSAVGPNTTTVNLVYSTRTFANVTTETKEFVGSGPNWRNVSGVPLFWIDYPQPFEVLYQNFMDEESIIHVHGQKQPIGEDGVPYISAPPMQPKSQLYSTFPLDTVESWGTYWMHSHFGFQLTEGMAAPFIVDAPIDAAYPLANELGAAQTVVLHLEDFCSKAADDTRDYYDCNCTIAYEILAAGFINETGNGTIPFPVCPNVQPADDMDVMFAAVLANKRTADDPLTVAVKPGEYVRLRIINTASMTNFYLTLPLNGTIVATDGQLTVPIVKEKLWIAVAQRLDILFQIPTEATENKNYLLTAQGESATTDYIRVAAINFQVAYDDVQPIDPVIVDASEFPPPGFMEGTDELTYQAFYPLAEKEPNKVFFLNLTGDNGFKSINGHSYQLYPMVQPPNLNPYPLKVSYGDRVQITLFNQNPDNHAFHLHGHSFQVLEVNGNPINGAMRDTVLVPQACGEVVIAFDAINPGTWLFHCHMEFHMMAGMITTVEYEV